jgi:hypothetical protein
MNHSKPYLGMNYQPCHVQYRATLMFELATMSDIYHAKCYLSMNHALPYLCMNHSMLYLGMN